MIPTIVCRLSTVMLLAAGVLAVSSAQIHRASAPEDRITRLEESVSSHFERLVAVEQKLNMLQRDMTGLWTMGMGLLSALLGSSGAIFSIGWKLRTTQHDIQNQVTPLADLPKLIEVAVHRAMHEHGPDSHPRG